MGEDEQENEQVVDQGLGLLDSQPEEGQLQEPDNNQPAINPAWNPLLGVLPSSLHGMVTPHLKTWDQNVQQLVGKVHSQYEPYKPFLEQKLDPSELMTAHQVYQALEKDPVKFIEAVMEHYGIQPEQGQELEDVEEDDGEPELFDVTQHPEFQRYGQMTEKMAELLLQQQQQAEDAQMDEELDNDINDAKQRLGDFDEDFVLQRVLYFDEDIDSAVAAYNNFVQEAVSKASSANRSAPIIMGSGGGIPSQQKQVSNLSGQDRRALITQMLENAQAQGG